MSARSSPGCPTGPGGPASSEAGLPGGRHGLSSVEDASRGPSSEACSACATDGAATARSLSGSVGATSPRICAVMRSKRASTLSRNRRSSAASMSARDSRSWLPPPPPPCTTCRPAADGCFRSGGAPEVSSKADMAELTLTSSGAASQTTTRSGTAAPEAPESKGCCTRAAAPPREACTLAEEAAAANSLDCGSPSAGEAIGGGAICVTSACQNIGISRVLGGGSAAAAKDPRNSSNVLASCSKRPCMARKRLVSAR
mmetsp:Transcript_70799/g.196006  ORF Transcript_70799/g.196006 Transcript_70799/m.196006 type:complete len:257 (-) Transcript_70799:417-1187(-)